MPKIEVTHDGQLDLATTTYRKKQFTNKKWYWSDLLTRISETQRTYETHEAYMKLGSTKAGKDRQAEIKDVGGYVGGYLTGGVRRKDRVMHRQLITLDLDHLALKDSPWDDFQLLTGAAAAIYSTHKHSPDHPRLRLIMPLNREVSTLEYEAIARKIASYLVMDWFDISTYQYERLMYWPSTSKDGEYVFHHQDGPWMDADEILKTYVDWTDESAWPVSSHEDQVVRKALKKVGDPRDKDNIIGHFCSAYSVTEAIETFIPDVYSPTILPNRWSLNGGTTSNGLVIYDDLHAYSHHGSDPAFGHAQNAFDLVRIHMFGDLDTGKEELPVTQRPSYAAMTELAAGDPLVVQAGTRHSVEQAKADFIEFAEEEGIIPAGDPEAEDAWMKKMDVDKKGAIKQTINNVATILANDPNLRGRLARNIFENRDMAIQNLPWRKVTKMDAYIKDSDDASIRNYLEKVYKITNRNIVQDGLKIHFEKNCFHPVRDYLDKLTWDQTPRLDTLLIDQMGAEDSGYIRAVTRKTFTAAVARVMRPGIKFDTVLTLIGDQGLGKSSIINRMGKHWFSDSFSTVQGKDSFEQIQGVWIIEIGEMAGFKRAEMETVKHFVAKKEDRFRVPYGARTENFPRQCVFIATTNDEKFLKDQTGNRRFWPVVVNTKFAGLAASLVDQLWAEAVHYYENGEKLYLTRELEEEAAEVQLQHTEIDARIDGVIDYLNMPLPASWEDMNTYQRVAYWKGDREDLKDEPTHMRTRVCVMELWCECYAAKMSELTLFNAKGLHDILRHLKEWKYVGKQRIKPYGIQRAYDLFVTNEL